MSPVIAKRKRRKGGKCQNVDSEYRGMQTHETEEWRDHGMETQEWWNHMECRMGHHGMLYVKIGRAHV